MNYFFTHNVLLIDINFSALYIDERKTLKLSRYLPIPALNGVKLNLFVGLFGQSLEDDVYDKVCDGCPTNCTRCEFEDPEQVPQCISLAEAGVEHASSSGGLSTVEDLILDEGYWRATNTSTNVKECFNADACPGGLTTGVCNSGYRGPCEHR